MNKLSKIIIPFFMGLLMMLAFNQITQASESLKTQSASQISTNVSGLNSHDVKILINEKQTTQSAMQLAENQSQDLSKVDNVEASLGCSMSCTAGCSAGCTVSCTNRCSQ
jgi:hypothetical protein